MQIQTFFKVCGSKLSFKREFYCNIKQVDRLFDKEVWILMPKGAFPYLQILDDLFGSVYFEIARLYDSVLRSKLPL